MIEAIHSIWTEKYRPKTLNDIVLSSETRDILNKFKEDKSIPNLLLVGPPGVGKTSIAKIIVNHILECDYLYINASDENGIDTIRNKVISFAQTKSLNGGIKVVICDEMDGLSGDAMRAMRNTMEEYSISTRFILTANYKHKIIPALQSRCQTLSFNYELKDAVVRCFNILQAENVTLTKEQKDPFLKLVKTYFPDLRKIVNELQKSSFNGCLAIKDVSNVDKFANQLFTQLQTKDIVSCRRYAIENEGEFYGDYHNLMKAILECIYNSKIVNKSEAIVTVAEHMYRCSFCVDQEINFFACLINVQKLIKTNT
jgi:DNA polymerase III delta prime subunit